MLSGFAWALYVSNSNELVITIYETYDLPAANMLFAKAGQTEEHSAFTILFNFCPSLTSNFQLYGLTSTKGFIQLQLWSDGILISSLRK